MERGTEAWSRMWKWNAMKEMQLSYPDQRSRHVACTIMRSCDVGYEAEQCRRDKSPSSSHRDKSASCGDTYER